MKAVAKSKPGPGLQLIETDVPKPGPGEILVKVKYASICGSDVHIYKWDEFAQTSLRQLPRIVGHESAGEVVEVGPGVESPKVGDYIGVETHIACGKCYQCRIGKPHVCKNVEILGFNRDGAFAEYMVIPAENAWKIPESIPKDWVPLMEPMGNAVHTVLADDITGKNVLVVGTGPIGAMAVAVAKASGARKVIATDINEFRLKIASRMGADLVLNPEIDDVRTAVMDETSGNGVDVVIEMSGNPNALNQGFEMITNGGWVGLLGLYGKNRIDVPMNDIIMKNLTLYGIVGRKMYETWAITTALLESGKVDLSPLITHRVTLEEYEEAFNVIFQGRAMKVLFEIDPS
ncbi:MAG: L-threonine 3-dehydrogenase [Thermotogae bacterium]|nr:L-threonine 3-dehydrogenase [Thermotogota bacterium]